ncbi:hypothetical protein A3Q56_03570 [Intoshia linei]|uniref:Sof1-like protein domain-containing protein n=1 Tax=Intoshia linei TaxID=1819745 RepID=A0A177B357_9BILA|nr:hypothetical protein A3Q56_03570 [Intoshia linei]
MDYHSTHKSNEFSEYWFTSWCGDRIIKCWSTQKDFLTEEIFSISTKSRLLFMDYCRNSTTFLTSGDKIDVWVDDRSVPTNSLKWGCDSINCSKFNPIETNIIASTCSDNSIILYDLRDSTPMKKMVMDMASNSLCWNPMDPSSLTIANEDYNLYTFDIRNFKKARNVHKDHVSSENTGLILDSTICICPHLKSISAKCFIKNSTNPVLISSNIAKNSSRPKLLHIPDVIYSILNSAVFFKIYKTNLTINVLFLKRQQISFYGIFPITIIKLIDLDYSPTGTEFVSASYDKSLRIFNSNKGHSRDVYTTKRMQRVMCCKWTLDNKFILSGSDETNVRLWKSGASDKMGTLMYREKMHLNYCNSLKNKYKHHPQIKRIANHRHLPKDIYSERKQLRECHDAAEKRFKNKQMNSGKRKIAKVSERKKSIQNVLN